MPALIDHNCQAGNHTLCQGRALDVTSSRLTVCPCQCHSRMRPFVVRLNGVVVHEGVRFTDGTVALRRRGEGQKVVELPDMDGLRRRWGTAVEWRE